jgi:16S rRNA (cytosine967-C5)-methyltransferase
VPGLHAALLVDGPPLESSSALRDGLVTPQARGSQLAAAVAASGSPGGRRIVDLCAAPGGKTAQLRALLPAWEVLAVEIDPKRAVALRANLDRLGAPAEVLEADATNLPADLHERFDAVLLDAPCSGLGTLASRADLRWRRRPADVDRLASAQRGLLDSASRLVAPGGTLTYAVCTWTQAESLGVLEAFLIRGGWVVDDLGEGWPELAHPSAGGFLLTLPPDGGTSVFFVARLRRMT